MATNDIGPHSGWDVFVSHATEDKITVARPLGKLLEQLGLQVWLDERELRVGDSLRRQVDNGLARSRFGVVILSESFFEKHWTASEYAGLFAKQSQGRKVILPVWHRVTHSDVARYSPSLADTFAANTQDGLELVAASIVQAIASADGRDGAQPANPKLAFRDCFLAGCAAGQSLAVLSVDKDADDTRHEEFLAAIERLGLLREKALRPLIEVPRRLQRKTEKDKQFLAARGLEAYVGALDALEMLVREHAGREAFQWFMLGRLVYRAALPLLLSEHLDASAGDLPLRADLLALQVLAGSMSLPPEVRSAIADFGRMPSAGASGKEFFEAANSLAISLHAVLGVL